MKILLPAQGTVLRKIIDYIHDNDGVTTSDIAKYLCQIQRRVYNSKSPFGLWSVNMYGRFGKGGIFRTYCVKVYKFWYIKPEYAADFDADFDKTIAKDDMKQATSTVDFAKSINTDQVSYFEKDGKTFAFVKKEEPALVEKSFEEKLNEAIKMLVKAKEVIAEAEKNLEDAKRNHINACKLEYDAQRVVLQLLDL